MNVGEKLKNIRIDNNLKQEQVAAATGINRTKISKIENNKEEPNLQQLHDLIEFYGINANWLLDTGVYNNE